MIDWDGTDDELAVRLGSALARVDPVPASVVSEAKASGAWRAFEAELISLMYDSVFDADELAGVRGRGSRLLAFSSPDVTIEMEVLGDEHSLIGQITGMAPTRLEIFHGDASTTTVTDAVGHFSYRYSGRGPVRIRATDDRTGKVIQTEWVVL